MSASIIRVDIRRYLLRRLPVTIVTTAGHYPASERKSVRHVASRRHRRADDSGGVLQGGGHHRGAVFQQRDPLAGLSADAATGDEQLGTHRVLDGDQALRYLLGPLFVAPAALVADRRRRPAFGLLAADLEMTEF